jgi:hypothetical protein
MANSPAYNSSSCPRCRTEGQCLGAQAEATWYLCPTCRFAWQKKTVETGAFVSQELTVPFPLVLRA